MVQNYKNLKIWQKSIDLAVKIYQFTKNFPKSEVYNLTSQLKRASISVSANIAEGASRNTKKDHSRFINQAYSSLKEVECLVILSYKLKYIKKEQMNEICEDIDHLSRMIYKFDKIVKV